MLPYVLLQGLKNVVSEHAERRERRRAVSDGVLPLAQNLLGPIVELGTRFGPRLDGVTWSLPVAKG